VKRKADKSSESLIISIDTKAKVNIGEFSRGGKTREKEPEKALDHDMEPDSKLVPFGIFEPSTYHLSVILAVQLKPPILL